MRRREFITLLGGAAVVAACGGRAAAGDAGDRVSQRPHRPMVAHASSPHSAEGSSETGLFRGPERHDRISLGAKAAMIDCRR